VPISRRWAIKVGNYYGKRYRDIPDSISKGSTENIRWLKRRWLPLQASKDWFSIMFTIPKGVSQTRDLMKAGKVC